MVELAQRESAPNLSSLILNELDFYMLTMAFSWKASHGHVATLLDGHWLTDRFIEQTRTNMSAKSATGVE